MGQFQDDLATVLAALKKAGQGVNQYAQDAYADPANQIGFAGPVGNRFIRDNVIGTAKQLVNDWGGVKPAMRAADSAQTLIDILSGKEKSVPFAPAYAGQKATDTAANAGQAAMDVATWAPMVKAALPKARPEPSALEQALRSNADKLDLQMQFNKIKGPANDAPEWASFPNTYDPKVADAPGLPGQWLSSPEGRDYFAQMQKYYPNDPEKALMLARNRAALFKVLDMPAPSNAAEEYANGLQAFRDAGVPEADALRYMKGHAGEPGTFDPANPPPASNADLIGDARNLSGSIWDNNTELSPDVKKYTNALVKQKTTPPELPSATVLPFGKPPTTLSMGFGFGGKDGQRSLAQIIGDALKGKKASPLDQFTPPTSIDDIFTGGAPRGAREITGGAENPAGLEGSFLHDPRFTGAPEVPYNPETGFGGLDARLGKQKPLGYDDWSPEWRAAYDKGLPMDTASRMARAREQGFDVDEPVYHGTFQDFPAFDTTRAESELALGSHFGTKRQANGRLESLARDQFEENSRVMPLLTNIKNPVRLEDMSRWNAEDVLRQLDSGPNPIRAGDQNLDYYSATAPEIRDAIKKAGHDGIVYENRYEGDGDSLIAFDPSQIRSVNAAFDPANIGKANLLGAGVGPTQGQPIDDLLAILLGYGALGGMSAGALATMDAQRNAQRPGM